MNGLSMTPVLLWTDGLLFLVLAAIGAYALHVRRQPQLLAPWTQVASKPMAAASAVVLLLLILIGLLDSVHLRQDQGQEEGQILSLLDLSLSGLRDSREKTYSAPLASYSHAKEAMRNEQGQTLRAYPRLVFGGAHLQNPHQDRAGDLAYRALAGASVALLLTAILLIPILGRGWWRRSPSRRTVGITVLILAALVGVMVAWAQGYHLFGTDKIGQDVLLQTLKGIRTALVIGLLTTLVMLPLALVLGVAAGYFRGWVDDVVQYTYTTLSSIPSVLLIAAAVLMMQVYMDNHPQWFDTLEARADLRLLFLCIILGVTSWTGLCRLLRAETLKLRSADYIQSAVAVGSGHGRVLLSHVLPNVMHIVLIQITLDFSGLVLAEAVLSYVGVGVDPSMDSWGNMINGARLELAREPVVWWSLSAAFLFMFSLVLAANLFADAVRQAFDPRS